MNGFKLLLILCVILFSPISYAQKNVSESLKKELEDAETKMFQNVNFTHANSYFKTDVSDDFFTINADGVVANKEQSLADTERLKMFEMGTTKFFDKKIRVYGNVGIINGRGQVFFDGKYIVEFLYTAIFVKEKGKWMYTSWQGTISKDSPPPPPMPKN
ncbi:uncharacterized protein DUF4440 [Flavobacterium sp. 103]|uniref:nuclear transport factor 2 family protein n=1 Tax=Flavobacterium sp. 103 TaxID=2135624 RepID=UPI000D5EE4EA|nr:nuclear transport factor 2 family protein [Flavobacterium sp. 103]PVX44923.1 uncharacterized protein DUF4440 [Flavobacterium sp. 103]